MFNIPILTNPDFESDERANGFIFGALYSFSVSFAMIIVKKLSQSVPNTIIIHYALISGTFISGLDLIMKGEFNSAIYKPENFIWLIFISCLNYSA